MRKSVLILVVLLVSATAHAGGTRGLSAPDAQQAAKSFRQAEVTVLPAPDEEKLAAQPAIEPPKSAEPLPAEQATPVANDGKRAADVSQPLVKAADTKTMEAKTIAMGKTERRAHAKPRKKRTTTEVRIRYELGRYGITW